jgi:predicted ATPase
MKLVQLTANSYRSLKSLSLSFGSVNLLIGANAAGKSNIVDALRFLSDGLVASDFESEVYSRGGIVHLAWKGEQAKAIELTVTLSDEPRELVWTVALVRASGVSFHVKEDLYENRSDGPLHLLHLEAGKGWWWSQEASKRVPLALAPSKCGLAAAAADASFPARGVAEFVGGWGFFDPSPWALRRSSPVEDTARLDSIGRNLASRLWALREQSHETYDRILAATRSILGVPTELELIVSESDGRVFFLQSEPGLNFRVHQVGTSSGTLRMLALMTALFGESDASLVSIEEPENHVHPSALRAFADHLRDASQRVQVIVTTHSPLLLDYLGMPDSVCVVRRTSQGTGASRETDPDAVRTALEESGFGLGEFHETKGFGA